MRPSPWIVVVAAAHVLSWAGPPRPSVSVAGPALTEVGGAAAQATASIVPVEIDLKVAAREELPRLRVEAGLTFRVDAAGDVVRFRLRSVFEVTDVVGEDGIPLDYRRRGNAIVVPDPGLRAGAVTRWTFRFVWPLSRPLGELPGVFSSEPWYPYVLASAPGEVRRIHPTRARIAVQLPGDLAVASAGTLNLNDRIDGREWIWTRDEPVSLHPLVVGRFETHSANVDGWSGVGFFASEFSDRADDFLEYAGRVLQFYAEEFGPLEGNSYSLTALPLPAGLQGLTLPGLTLIGARHLEQETAFPYRILAHEIAHNWWGLRLSFRDSSDGWLHEGLPTYSALLFIERALGQSRLTDELDNSRRIALSSADPEPLVVGLRMRDGQARYTQNYHKAAMVLHMLRVEMGRDRFVELLGRFFDEHRDTPASARGFRELAESIHGDDLAGFFHDWVEAAAVPRFTVEYSVEPLPRSNPPAYRLAAVVRQDGAAVEAPVRVRVFMAGAPPLDHVFRVGAGTTELELICPAPPVQLEFDPFNDLLHAGFDVRERDAGGR